MLLSVIQVEGLTKRFGDKRAVDDLSFTAGDGRVTGFVGPNGAGKSTTLRCLAGLDTPSGGRALIDRVPYRRLNHPARTVGTLLDPAWVHPGRTGVAHLRWVARAARVPARRCTEVLELTGITSVAGKRVSSYSLGMRQRLGLATALLGEPDHLVLDEPLNGLDPEGVRWMRDLVTGYASSGRCVLISSHLLSELELVADDVVLIGQGRLIGQHRMHDLLRRGPTAQVTLRLEGDVHATVEALTRAGWTVEPAERELLVTGPGDPDDIGRVCARTGAVVLELRQDRARLEDAVLNLTRGQQEYVSGGAA